MKQDDLHDFVKEVGAEHNVRGKVTREVILSRFEADVNKVYDLDANQKEYIQRKMRKYKKQINFALTRLKNDKETRQAVIVFDVYSSRPNCIVLIQLLYRKGTLRVIVYSRSLDIKGKLNQDIALVQKIAKLANDIVKANNILIDFVVGSLHYYIYE